MKEILALLQFNVLWYWLVYRGMWIAKDYTCKGDHKTGLGAQRFSQRQQFLQMTNADCLMLHVVGIKKKDC